jgi:hypothetical protein
MGIHGRRKDDDAGENKKAKRMVGVERVADGGGGKTGKNSIARAISMA